MDKIKIEDFQNEIDKKIKELYPTYEEQGIWDELKEKQKRGEEITFVADYSPIKHDAFKKGIEFILEVLNKETTEER